MSFWDSLMNFFRNLIGGGKPGIGKPVDPKPPETQPGPKMPESVKTYRPICFVSDNIYISGSNPDADKENINSFIAALSAEGVQSRVFGFGPHAYLDALQSTDLEDDALLVELAGGSDAGSIYEKAGSWYKNIKGSRKDCIVFMDTAKKITGLDRLERAHDDDYDPASFTGIDHPDQFLRNNGYNFIEGVKPGEISSAVDFIINQALVIDPISQVTPSALLNDPNNVDKSVNYAVSQSDFNLMINAVANFSGTPDMVYLRQNGVKLSQFVTWNKYLEIKDRWDNFVKTNDGNDPAYICINKPCNPPVIKDCYSSPKYKEVIQPDDYTCGPTSSVMALYELDIIDSVDNLADLEQTVREPDGGTAPNDLMAGVVADGKKFGVLLQTSKGGFPGWKLLGEMLDDPNVAVILHGMTDGWPSYYAGSYGHYVYPVELCLSSEVIWIADPDRNIIKYDFEEFKAGVDLISTENQMIVIKKGV